MDETELLRRALAKRPSVDALLALPNGGLLAQGDATSACYLHHRFDLIILCAQELQRSVATVHPRSARARLVYAPNDDATLTGDQLVTAFQAAQFAAYAIGTGKRVLVTCMQGRNRSGLVSALTAHMLLGLDGSQAADLVRRRRLKAPALTNDSFNEFLARIPALRRQVPTPQPTASVDTQPAPV